MTATGTPPSNSLASRSRIHPSHHSRSPPLPPPPRVQAEGLAHACSDDSPGPPDPTRCLTMADISCAVRCACRYPWIGFTAAEVLAPNTNSLSPIHPTEAWASLTADPRCSSRPDRPDLQPRGFPHPPATRALRRAIARCPLLVPLHRVSHGALWDITGGGLVRRSSPSATASVETPDVGGSYLGEPSSTGLCVRQRRRRPGPSPDRKARPGLREIDRW